MKILVTGGSGFIGSHLCERLLADGHKVINLDNFCDFYDPKIKRSNISWSQKQVNYHLCEGDIRDQDFVEKVFRENEIEMVIHVAAMAGVRPSIENPQLYCTVNVNGTQNLLEACRKHQIKKFIFASSSSIYGNNRKVPFAETDSVDHPISPYAATKKMGELLCYSYHYLFDMSMICLRFFTVYGPRQRPDLAIYKFTKFLLEGTEIPLFGDGSTSRDYTFYKDIINGIMGAAEYVNAHKCYEIFNLGESQTITLKKMVTTIEKELDIKGKYKWLEMQQGDVNITYSDITKAKEMLGYAPDTEFSAGIREFVKWFKNNINISEE